MPNQAFLAIDEKVRSLVQPDTLAAFQYFIAVEKKTQLAPEKRLLLAVLEDAVRCFQKYAFAQDKKGKDLFREAEQWISDKNANWPFSFEYVCDVFGFNPGYFRKRLTEWKKAEAARSKKIQVLRPKMNNEAFNAISDASYPFRQAAGR